jgi:hypothetical protein
MPNVYASSMPSVWEAFNAIEWRVVGAAANPKSLTIHDIVEAVFAGGLLILLRSSHLQ